MWGVEDDSNNKDSWHGKNKEEGKIKESGKGDLQKLKSFLNEMVEVYKEELIRLELTS